MKITPIVLLLGSLLFAGTAAAKTSDVLGSCEVRCDQKLASCEKKLGVRGHCPRLHDQCLTGCKGAPNPSLLSPRDRQRTICEQKCDLNRTNCERANPQLESQCADTRKNCIARCR